MKVGSIVDCLSNSIYCYKIMRGATKYLIKGKVDLIFVNHSHKEWNKSLKITDFLKEPSNYLFSTANELANKLESFEINKDNFFITLGDGVGPINL